MAVDQKKSVLFVCLGNTCRSPIAQAVFLTLLKQENLSDKWHVDSAGIADWHAGKGANSRSLQIMEKYNLFQFSHKARQIKPEDFQNFDYIVGMDSYNLEDLQHLADKEHHSKLFVLGEFDPKGILNIKDPYFENRLAGFEACYEQCLRSCKGFLEKVENIRIPD